MSFAAELLTKIKTSLRISGADLDTEITDLINAGKKDLEITGVNNILSSDALIVRAIILYCKANFGYDNPEADRFQKSYDLLKMHLSLSGDYIEV